MANLTSHNFKKATVIVTLDCGEHIIATTKNQYVFNTLATFCEFALVDNSQVSEIPISEIIKKGE